MAQYPAALTSIWHAMTIFLEKPTDDEIAYFDKTIANAKRLAADARLLIENERTYSAIMLAILAIEELGKALITFWGVRNKANKRGFPSHVEKQSAMFSLLVGVEATRMTASEFRELTRNGGDFHSLGPLSSQFAYARSGFFDDFRMAVTYADRTPKLPLHEAEDVISASIGTELLDWFELACASIHNGSAMELASCIYENDLGRL